MTLVLVDTNIAVDVISNHPQFAERSARLLERLSSRARLVINAVIYAELSVAFVDQETLDRELRLLELEIAEIPRAGLFLAGKAFLAYRRRGGPKTSVLPDFLIGGHAAALGVPLATRDAPIYRSYFPDVDLVTP